MDDTGQPAAKLFWMTILALTIFEGLTTTVTVEEGKAAILTCPGFVPNPEHDNEKYAGFTWFKASQADHSKRVAFYDKTDNVQNSLGDLSGRATVDGTTGALEIPQTRVSDDHVYTCDFASGNIQNETQLVITVTPSESDLKVTASPPDFVREGRSVTFKCSASRVRPPPKQMFWKFATSQNRLPEQYKNATNRDGLTSAVSVEYTMIVDRSNYGSKLQCYYITAVNAFSSLEEATVYVIFKPSVQPQIQGNQKAVTVNSEIMLTCDAGQDDGIVSWYKWQFANGTELGNTSEKTWIYKVKGSAEILMFECIAGNVVGESAPSAPIAVQIKGQPYVMIILGALLACSLVGNLTMAVCICCRRKCNKDADDGYAQPSFKNVANISKKRKDAKLQENSPAVAASVIYEEPDNAGYMLPSPGNVAITAPAVNEEQENKEVPYYLELH